jgi:hypothetical protein
MGKNVVIVTARCSLSKQSYGIRIERRGARQWAATWAFAIKEAAARREGYDKSRIEGSFVLDAAFPGCPLCKANGFYLCGCGKVACWNNRTTTVVCPWCSKHGEIGGEVTGLDAGSDR